MLPDLESLRCFEAAARRLSFADAAREVALSRPAFSERIRLLEELLGAALFTRSTRRVALTPAGARLLPQAERVLAESVRCFAAVREEGDAAPYDLTVGTRYELGLTWLVPSLPFLQKIHPERRIHLRFGDSPDLLQHVLARTADAAVTSARFSSTALDHAVLHPEEFAFVASPRLLARRPLRSRADAPAHVLLDAHAELPLFRYFLDAHPARDVWAFQHVERLGTIAAIRHRVLEGHGVAVLPVHYARRDLAAGRMVRVMPRVRLQTDQFRLVWARGHPREPELRVLADDLRGIRIT